VLYYPSSTILCVISAQKRGIIVCTLKLPGIGKNKSLLVDNEITVGPKKPNIL
jgi:hypothetical protein